jgi:hypothetical protein
MNDWVPVITLAVLVGGVTAYLLLEPKFRTRRKGR